MSNPLPVNSYDKGCTRGRGVMVFQPNLCKSLIDKIVYCDQDRLRFFNHLRSLVVGKVCVVQTLRGDLYDRHVGYVREVENDYVYLNVTGRDTDTASISKRIPFEEITSLSIVRMEPVDPTTGLTQDGKPIRDSEDM